jgi:hypothetical protein
MLRQRQVIRRNGRIWVPPHPSADGQQHYLVTVCTVGSPSTALGATEHDDVAEGFGVILPTILIAGSDARTLGFLQISRF